MPRQSKGKSIFAILLMCVAAKALMAVMAYLFFGLVVVPLHSLSEGKTYITTNIEDYGKYIGNYSNKKAAKLIDSVFPEKIDPSFQDVTYSYRAMTGDSYAFEAYLEFTIEDKDAFEVYVSSITDSANWEPFQYDENYLQYRISDEYSIRGTPDKDSNPDDFHIAAADIRKILVSRDDQRIIYVAIGLHDGGYTRCSFLTTYFDRFQIDILRYPRDLAVEQLNR